MIENYRSGLKTPRGVRLIRALQLPTWAELDQGAAPRPVRRAKRPRIVHGAEPREGGVPSRRRSLQLADPAEVPVLDVPGAGAGSDSVPESQAALKMTTCRVAPSSALLGLRTDARRQNCLPTARESR